MRPKSIVLLVLALGCGLVASIGINQALSQPAPQAAVGETGAIFVALTQINSGDPITPAIVKLEPWQADKIPPGAITKLEDLEDRRARTPLFPGEPLLDGKLLAKGEMDDITGRIPSGMRVVPVKVDAVSGGAGLLKPGDHVDVLVHVNENPTKGILKAQTISPKDLQNLKLFAIDSVHTRDKNGESTVVAKTISLVVTPQQAKLVTLATELGSIRLAGRNAHDLTTSSNNEEVVGVEQLFNGLGTGSKQDTGAFLTQIKELVPAVVPVITPEAKVEPPKESTREVMIIREGTTARQVIFENGVPIELGEGTTGSPSPPPAAPAGASEAPAGEPGTKLTS